jgi:hypothetical protein
MEEGAGYLIDPPSPFSSIEEWRSFGAKMLRLKPCPEIRFAIELADDVIARLEANPVLCEMIKRSMRERG